MKKLFTILTVLIFSLASYAQTAKVNGNEDLLRRNLESESSVSFIMPDGTTDAEIEKSAQYYTDYMTIKFDKNTKICTIVLKNSRDEVSRRVITRFLLSAGIRNISFEGNEFSIMEFYDKFLKIE